MFVAVVRLSSGFADHLVPVVQKVDSTIHQISLYPLESAMGFPNIYPLDNDLYGG